MEYYNAHPDEAAIFNSAMTHRPEDSHIDVAEIYDFSAASLIVGVGGGNGALLRSVLSRRSGPKGVTYYRDAVVREAVQLGRLAEFGDRHRFQGGNFWNACQLAATHISCPTFSAFFPNEACVEILRNCRAVMRKQRYLLVMERILDSDRPKDNPSDFLVNTVRENVG